MRANWKEVQTDTERGKWAAMRVTLNARGDLAMSAVTWERMGSPAAFVVLFDGVNNRIGLKPAERTTRNAFRCSQRGRYGAKVLRVYRLIVDHRIDLTETLEFFNPARDEDGILVLDLRTAKLSARAAAFKKRPARNT